MEIAKSDLMWLKQGVLMETIKKIPTTELLQTLANKIFEQQDLFDEARGHIARAQQQTDYLTSQLSGEELADAQSVEDELGVLETIIEEGILTGLLYSEVLSISSMLKLTCLKNVKTYELYLAQKSS